MLALTRTSDKKLSLADEYAAVAELDGVARFEVAASRPSCRSCVDHLHRAGEPAQTTSPPWAVRHRIFQRHATGMHAGGFGDFAVVPPTVR
jgi:hypothetical protein